MLLFLLDLKPTTGISLEKHNLAHIIFHFSSVNHFLLGEVVKKVKQCTKIKQFLLYTVILNCSLFRFVCVCVCVKKLETEDIWHSAFLLYFILAKVPSSPERSGFPGTIRDLESLPGREAEEA